jgi:uncharacterized C2H2 Zn-finger protein
VKFAINYYEEERLDEDPVEQDPEPENEDVYQCSSCNFNFSNVEDHLKTYHSEPSDDIIEVINSEPQEEHDDESSDGAGLAYVVKNEFGMYECNVCFRIFKGLKRFVNHMKLHDSISPETIEGLEQCAMKKEVNAKEENCIKLKDADGENVYRCKQCNVQFSTKKQLLLHTSIHKNVESAKSKWTYENKSLDCQYCNKSFPNRFEFDLHVQAHDELLKKNQSVNAADELKPPTAAQKKKGVHTCQYCNKEFTRPHEKVKHERVHTGEKPYSCDICGKKFRVTYCLSLHKRNVHSEDRPYICTFAGCKKR